MNAQKPYILLIFDVDGTLTFSDGATSRALGRAFVQLTGIDVGPGVKFPAGKTDPQIFREMLKTAGIHADDFDSLFSQFKELFFPIAQEELRNANRARLLPGVRELLTAISKDHRFAMTLGTGNLQDSGMEKLRIHGVDHFFPVGGFGSDAEDRSQILRIALKRSEEHWHTRFELANTWVIGDTPRDVAAGKALGAHILSVATGVYKPKELEEANPDGVLETLEDQEKFFDIVLNTRK
jgi:phosphoglycolate phosphatase